MLILHGTADKTVDVKQSELFAAALKKVGAVHELVIVEGRPHTFTCKPKQARLPGLMALGGNDSVSKAASELPGETGGCRDKQPENHGSARCWNLLRHRTAWPWYRRRIN